MITGYIFFGRCLELVLFFFENNLSLRGFTNLTMANTEFIPWKCWYKLIYVSYYVLLMVILLPMIHSHIHFLMAIIYISYGYYMLTMIYSHIKKSCSRTPVDGGWRRLQGTWNVVCCQSSPGHCRVALHLWVHRCSLLEWNWKTSTNTTKELQDTICLETCFDPAPV